MHTDEGQITRADVHEGAFLARSVTERVLLHGALFLLILFTARLGLLFASLPPGNLTVIWLPAGVAVTGLLVLGAEALPTIFLASLTVHVPCLVASPASPGTGLSLLCSLGPALVDTVLAALAWTLLRRFAPDNPFHDGGGVLRFLVWGAVLPCILTGWISVLLFHLAGYTAHVGQSQLLLHGVVVVLGDALGICLAVPLYFAFREPEPDPTGTNGLAGVCIAFSASAAFCWLTFLALPQGRYLLMPLLLFLTLSTGLRGLSTALLIISLASAAATSGGHGPFVETTTAMSYAHLASFLLFSLPPFHYLQGLLREQRGSRELLKRMVGERTRELEEANRRLQEIADTDELTGARTRRRFLERGHREVQRALRYGRPLAMLALDIDHFKRVNDTHGHAVGDEVLRLFSAVVSVSLRADDCFGRMGGEEFNVLLPETDLAQALLTADKLRAAVAAQQLRTSAGTLRQTVSVGVAGIMTGEELDELLRRADKALYLAKRAGRNRVVAME